MSAPDFLNMSDEELLAYQPPSDQAAPVEETPEVVEDPAPVETPAEEIEEDQADAATDEDAGAAEVPAGEGEADAEGEDALAAAVANANAPASQNQADSAPKQEAPAAPAAPVDAIDYKAAYERLTTPFKANGRDIAVKSVDDAIALMQMGANYNKKMAALKPNMKLLKLLENNGLLSEQKLGYLIDLDKKNPDAINKLVKDSGIDPLDLSADKASAYKPTAYAVDDREIELDQVLDEIQGTPAYNRTLDIVSNKWDGPSKQVIAQSPQLLKVINTHVDSGMYDLIVSEIESERVFGRLNGLSDIEAYRQVGDAIQARGGFNHLGQGSSPAQAKPAAVAPVVVPPKPSQADADRLRDKRRAAGASTPAAPASVPADFNPLALSDDEFARVGLPKFL